MKQAASLYDHSLALLTDLYQLTMAYGYWKLGQHRKEAAFHLFFRKNPFDGGFAIACGLESIIEYLERLKFTSADMDYLAGLQGNDGQPLFERKFLDALIWMKFECDVDAVEEGSIVFANEPVIRVRGPIMQCQLLETALLTLTNFPTLVATKAARMCLAAKGDPVLEFGLRRAQGVDGGVTASRAAYVGGCSATSNVLAGQLFGIPVKGTHAHSWVMSFGNELEAFREYAKVQPHNCIFLVDTYNTLEGVRHACQVGKDLSAKGHKMIGVRLDSGDLAYLSIEARKILDEAGFPDATIVATNDLDEHLIASLKEQGAKIDVWGVGTKLATAYDQPALGGVYKLTAVRESSGAWEYRLKLSEQRAKISTPGMLQVRRFIEDGYFVADAVYDIDKGIDAAATIVDPNDETRRKTIPASTRHEDLLIPIFRAGGRVYDPPGGTAARKRALEQLQFVHPTIRRFLNPHGYPVGLEKNLFELRRQLILKARGIES